MDEPLSITVAHKVKASVKVLQITDTHLFANKEQTLLGINTWQSYQAVLHAIQEQAQSWDLVVATGDLVQDQSIEAYQHFVSGILTIPAPCVWLPGNHDFQPAMRQVLTDAGISAEKQVLAGEAWQILLLDSQVANVAHGEISQAQLDWLAEKLQACPERHTLLLLHHHPIPVGCYWLDQHRLRNTEALDRLLNHYPQVKHLLYGHIHQQVDTYWHGRRLLATPATSVQFKPQSTRFALDTLAPGWRWLELHPDGQLSTQVCRIQQGLFLPNTSSQGY